MSNTQPLANCSGLILAGLCFPAFGVATVQALPGLILTKREIVGYSGKAIEINGLWIF